MEGFVAKLAFSALAARKGLRQNEAFTDGSSPCTPTLALLIFGTTLAGDIAHSTMSIPQLATKPTLTRST